jgi:hypothetical protein
MAQPEVISWKTKQFYAMTTFSSYPMAGGLPTSNTAIQTAHRFSLFTAPPAAGFTGNLFLASLSGLIYTSLPRIDPDTVSRTGGLAEQ